MTDHDALVRAICDCPDDDTPRLIYADFLEETGEAERAAFVRAQVELGRTPAWEPFAVLCRTRKREWSEAGEPFRASLPELRPEAGVEWHEQPFRRGLGWRVNVRSLHEWNRIAPRLYERAPVGELYLNPPATRDDWRAFAAGDWVRHFRIIHLDGTSPVEAIRALCENPAACGITDIHFHRSSSPGLPELVEDLLATPLGKGLKGLHFYVGYQAVDVLIDALATSAVPLERLTFHTMGLTPERLDRLFQAAITGELIELAMKNDRLGFDAEDESVDWVPRLPTTLRDLHLVSSSLSHRNFQSLAECNASKGLKSLDVSGNWTLRDAPDNRYPLFDSGTLTGLQRFVLRAANLGGAGWVRLFKSALWSNLVEVDMRGNSVFNGPIRLLLTKPLPARLLAFWLSQPGDSTLASALREHFGERVLFAPSE